MAVVSFHLVEKRKREREKNKKRDYLHFINRKHRFDEILEFGYQFAQSKKKTEVEKNFKKREITYNGMIELKLCILLVLNFVKNMLYTVYSKETLK